jgi:hypothetical protein
MPLAEQAEQHGPMSSKRHRSDAKTPATGAGSAALRFRHAFRHQLALHPRQLVRNFPTQLSIGVDALLDHLPGLPGIFDLTDLQTQLSDFALHLFRHLATLSTFSIPRGFDATFGGKTRPGFSRTEGEQISFHEVKQL